MKAMKAAVALAVSGSLLLVGCFPNNAQHRTYAKYAEGGTLVAGLVVSYFANTGADCDSMRMVNEDCRTHAKWISGVGVGLILAGLLGFIATVSTAEDDSESTPKVLSVEKTAPAADQGSAAGSAAGSDSAPPATVQTPDAGSAAAPAPAPAP
jgi:hypothetical protein